MRQEAWEPEVVIEGPIGTTIGKSFSEEIQRISDKYGIEPKKLQAILIELEKIKNQG